MYNFEEITKKYNYDEQFSEFLYKVYKELVQYYGNENIIYNAFLNTEIKNVNNIYEYLKENDMLEENTLVSDRDLKKSSGAYTSKPIISQINNKYEIVDTKRIILVKNFDIFNTNKKAILIHELCHMVKSYNNEHQIIDNLLISSSGIIERYYKLSEENGKVAKELIREKGVGLEEGLTSLAEEFITRKIVDKNYESLGYSSVQAQARMLMNYIHESIIKYSEMHHDKSILYDEIENYSEIEDLTDIAYKLNIEMYDKAFNPKELEKIKNAILSIMKEYKKIFNKERGKTR